MTLETTTRFSILHRRTSFSYSREGPLGDTSVRVITDTRNKRPSYTTLYVSPTVSPYVRV